ncbi:hypothetical protein ACFQVD_26775 [Streptosporangium amethystogenes subsp. fukuiense]|uniref:HTH luxR-type domain-containing protein n=1 Tax=Streptosporangium amethystogenes subsp. fukuiense TaxID=698418 RepID=A0ABW2T5M8_9ACTN
MGTNPPDATPARVRAVAASRIGTTLTDYDQHLTAGEKWCTDCKEWHSHAAFAKDASRSDGLQVKCREAAKKRPRKHRIITCTCCKREIPARTNEWCAACFIRWDQAGRPAAGPPLPRPIDEVNADRQAALARGRQTQLAMAAGRMEDFEFLLSTGETNRSALARRLGVQPSTVELYKTQLRRDQRKQVPA